MDPSWLVVRRQSLSEDVEFALFLEESLSLYPQLESAMFVELPEPSGCWAIYGAVQHASMKDETQDLREFLEAVTF